MPLPAAYARIPNPAYAVGILTLSLTRGVSIGKAYRFDRMALSSLAAPRDRKRRPLSSDLEHCHSRISVAHHFSQRQTFLGALPITELRSHAISPGATRQGFLRSERPIARCPKGMATRPSRQVIAMRLGTRSSKTVIEGCPNLFEAN